MCFVPLIPVWLITADSEGWTVQLALTSMALTCRNILLISVLPINHLVSYDRQIVGANCQVPLTPRALNMHDVLLDIAVIEEGSELKGRSSLLFPPSLKPSPFGFIVFALLTSR